MSEPIFPVSPRIQRGKPAPADINIAGGRQDTDFLDEKAFLRMLYLERRRTERSNRRFVLMLLEASSLIRKGNDQRTLHEVLSTLWRSTRETDIKGWYRNNAVLGVIFTEIEPAEGKAITTALLSRILGALCGAVSIEALNEIKISFHVYPEDPDSNGGDGPVDPKLYPEIGPGGIAKRASRIAKRSIDIAGSLLGIAVLSPLLIGIAIAVRLTSQGPALFQQQRVGIYGRRFTFLKFRSMYAANDDTVHKEYVKAFIEGTQNAAGRGAVYKLTDDPRITPLGKLLRRTSMDELPQLLNVLRGDMSLVGPRPALPYEVDAYSTWHRRRILAVKPGITGLWQVTGRSAVTFDEMVRLDLRYVSEWSPWLDIKILLQTPRAVVIGSGAR